MKAPQKQDPRLVWLIGIQTSVILLLVGIVVAMGSARIDRMEAKVDAIQAQYGAIPEIRKTVEAQSGRLTRMEDLILQLVRETRQLPR